jgi:hypothetical protein
MTMKYVPTYNTSTPFSRRLTNTKLQEGWQTQDTQKIRAEYLRGVLQAETCKALTNQGNIMKQVRKVLL